MNLQKIVTQKDVEIDTLKNYLNNKGDQFIESLVNLNTIEPVDIQYDNINYQITIGDQEAIEERRKAISQHGKYVGVRSIVNISDLLLSKALTKKSISSDPNTILLIEVTSTGARSWDDLENEFNDYILAHPELCAKWKDIYAVFPERNIRLYRPN